MTNPYDDLYRSTKKHSYLRHVVTRLLLVAIIISTIFVSYVAMDSSLPKPGSEIRLVKAIQSPTEASTTLEEVRKSVGSIETSLNALENG